jgi:hypothetical protein
MLSENGIRATRTKFNRSVAPEVARQLGFPTQPVDGSSARFACFQDDDRLLVVAGLQEARKIDLALSYGLTDRGSRRLTLALPTGHSFATHQRAAWLTDEARPMLVEHLDGVVRPLEAPSRDRSVAAVRRRAGDDPEKEYAASASPLCLSSGADLVASMSDVAAAFDLDSAHRQSELAWHYRGQRVLSLRTARGGVALRAGIHYSDDKRPAPLVKRQGEQLQEAELALLRDQIQRAVGVRRSSEDKQIHRPDEHWLQSILRRRPELLGLTAAEREAPAFRPGGAANTWSRGYVDLLGVDAEGAVHVVETKTGSNADPLFVLQGLDYYVWARAYGTALQSWFRLSAAPEMHLDLVVGTLNGTAPHLSRFTQALLEGVSPDVPIRFLSVTDWFDPAGRESAPIVAPVDVDQTWSTKGVR